MVSSSNILAEVVQHKRAEVRDLYKRSAELERQAADHMNSRRDFRKALRETPVAVIAEFKRASPSKGQLGNSSSPDTTARAYADGGAACMSVLTDSRFFEGSWDDLVAARAAAPLPVLRKDFTVDALQVVETAAGGADAVLLIAAVLDEPELRRFRELAETLRLAALVEVHNENELRKAIESGADLIGVNNRDLETFDVALSTSHRLAKLMPAGALAVSESGIHTAADVRSLAAAGYRAFLIGETLVRSADPRETLRQLRSAP